MNAEHLDLHAAIGLTPPAGMTLPAGDVGIDHTYLAGGRPCSCRILDNLHSQLMAHYARIRQERLFTLVDVVVRTTYADAQDANEHFTSASDGLFAHGNSELSWRIADESLHH